MWCPTGPWLQSLTYNTISPAGMNLAQLTEEAVIPVNQNAAAQMQIQSMHEQIMLKNIPVTINKEFIIALLKTY